MNTLKIVMHKILHYECVDHMMEWNYFGVPSSISIFTCDIKGRYLE